MYLTLLLTFPFMSVASDLPSPLLFLPAHSSIHVFPSAPHMHHCILETALLTAAVFTSQGWLDPLLKKPLTNSFLIIPEMLIHQHLLDLVAKFILPLPFILLQILLLWFVWWDILHCPLWRVEKLTQELIYWAFFSLPFLSEFFSIEYPSFSSATT